MKNFKIISFIFILNVLVFYGTCHATGAPGKIAKPMSREEALKVFGLKPGDDNMETITKQYKILSLECHPDRNHAHIEWAEAEFKELGTAYAVLQQPKDKNNNTIDREDIATAIFDDKTIEESCKIYGQLPKEIQDDPSFKIVLKNDAKIPQVVKTNFVNFKKAYHLEAKHWFFDNFKKKNENQFDVYKKENPTKTKEDHQKWLTEQYNVWVTGNEYEVLLTEKYYSDTVGAFKKTRDDYHTFLKGCHNTKKAQEIAQKFKDADPIFAQYYNEYVTRYNHYEHGTTNLKWGLELGVPTIVTGYLVYCYKKYKAEEKIINESKLSEPVKKRKLELLKQNWWKPGQFTKAAAWLAAIGALYYGALVYDAHTEFGEKPGLPEPQQPAENQRPAAAPQQPQQGHEFLAIDFRK